MPRTAEALAAAGAEFERYELWDGHLVVMEPAGWPSAAANAALVVRVGQHVAARALGHVFESSAGFVVQREPDCVLAPDLAFVSAARWPGPPKGAFPELVPDLVAEVRSPGQTWNRTLYRGGAWLHFGAQVVWMIDPVGRRATEFRPDELPVVLADAERDALSGRPVLPDLTIPLASIFPR